MKPRPATLYHLRPERILVSSNFYELHTYSVQKPFALSGEECAISADDTFKSEVKLERWPVEEIWDDGRKLYIVLDPDLRNVLELLFLEESTRMQLNCLRSEVKLLEDQRDNARHDAREQRKECRLLREELVDATVQIKNLTAPWYTQLWRMLRGEP